MSWRDHALCAQYEPSLFDYTLDEGEEPTERFVRIESAKAVFRHCPVMHECLAAVGRRDEGVRGGVLISRGRTL